MRVSTMRHGQPACPGNHTATPASPELPRARQANNARRANGRRERQAVLQNRLIELLLALTLSIPGVSSFVVPGHVQTARRRAIQPTEATASLELSQQVLWSCAGVVGKVLASSTQHGGCRGNVRAMVMCAPDTYTWSPQDLTKDRAGFLPISDDDYVKKYQRNPELWPVEVFLIAYRRRINKTTGKSETQILVRKSANGTSKWGVGTGVPVTRWIASTQEKPPLGYRWSEPPMPTQEPPRIRFEASSFPEFPKDGQESWSYDKIDICEDAFDGQFKDPELEEYASQIRKGLRSKLSEQMDDATNLNSWEANRDSEVKTVVDNANSLAAIQGTLRMSGLFARKEAEAGPRYVALGDSAPDPAKLVQSMRIFTMFPQMPSPMPSPSTPPEELRREIRSRKSRMAESGRDPHTDPYGRMFTHISTSNPSNTIHGVYLTLDATDLPELDEVFAVDLFGTKETKREWKSLLDLKVLESDGRTISTDDTKPTFISGFIVRQLVKDGVIRVDETEERQA
jgi:hypothetical protein